MLGAGERPEQAWIAKPEVLVDLEIFSRSSSNKRDCEIAFGTSRAERVVDVLASKSELEPMLGSGEGGSVSSLGITPRALSSKLLMQADLEIWGLL